MVAAAQAPETQARAARVRAAARAPVQQGARAAAVVRRVPLAARV
jgi:hypothetical protein